MAAAAVVQQIANMFGRVPRRVPCFGAEALPVHLAAILYDFIGKGDIVRTEHVAVGVMLPDAGNAADVVAVLVRYPNLRGRKVVRAQIIQHGLCFARVDEQCVLAVPHQPDVIVVQRGNGGDIQRVHADSISQCCSASRVLASQMSPD